MVARRTRHRQGAHDAGGGGGLGPQEAARRVDLVHEHGTVALPGHARQARAAWQVGVAAQRFEFGAAAAEVALGQRQVGGQPRVVVPQLDRAGVRIGLAAQQHHHRGELRAAKDRQRHGAVQAGRAGQLGAAEIRALQLAQQDRPALFPGRARQALAAAETKRAADGTKDRRCTINAPRPLEWRTVHRGGPDFCDADEGVHAPNDASCAPLWPGLARSSATAAAAGRCRSADRASRRAPGARSACVRPGRPAGARARPRRCR